MIVGHTMAHHATEFGGAFSTAEGRALPPAPPRELARCQAAARQVRSMGAAGTGGSSMDIHVQS